MGDPQIPPESMTLREEKSREIKIISCENRELEILADVNCKTFNNKLQDVASKMLPLVYCNFTKS